MTPPPSRTLMRRLNFARSRGVLWIGLTGLTVFTTGCFAPFIPLAVQGVGMLGQLVGVGAQAGTMVKHGNDEDPEQTEVMDQTKFDDSDFNSSSSKNPANAAKCNELILVTPAIIEFRADRTGTTQWRELGLGGSSDAPRWTVLPKGADATASAKDLAPGGWAPATNLDHMDFSPPLKPSAEPGNGSYLAYAPAVALAGVERDELASLELDFGPVVGTFKYNDRVFKYATLSELPCFPVPE
jgi:hypothetical protein